jgi:hypothetical protein
MKKFLSAKVDTCSKEIDIWMTRHWKVLSTTRRRSAEAKTSGLAKSLYE